MSQENEPIEETNLLPSPNEEASDKGRSVTEPLPSQKAKPVIFYIVIMFAVALFLIILSFFMQQRNHEALIEGLSSSSLHVQNLVDLEMEKNELEQTLDETLAELETAKAEKQTQEDAAAKAAQEALAMEYLMEARLSYASGKYKHARELLAEMQKQTLDLALPDTSALPDQTSPRAHYQHLVDALD